jgi:hypothetical protein
MYAITENPWDGVFQQHTKFFNYFFLRRALWYNYTTQTNEMRNFLNKYLISDVSYTFRTSWVHLQEDTKTHYPTHQTANTDACKVYHTAYRTMSVTGSQHLAIVPYPKMNHHRQQQQ